MIFNKYYEDMREMVIFLRSMVAEVMKITV